MIIMKTANLSQQFSQMNFRRLCFLKKNVSLFFLFSVLSFFFLFFALEKPTILQKKSSNQIFRKQLIQLSSDTNKLIRLNLKLVYNSSVLYFPKLLIQLCSDTNKLIRLNLKSVYNSSVFYFPKLFLTEVKTFLWFDLNHLNHVLMNFSLDVHRFSFTANHTHSH